MTAVDHRDAAVQLLADVNDHPESPGEARVLTQAAIAHALLGLLEIQLGRTGNADDAINAFDRFIAHHVDPSLHGHFGDDDDNDAERVRRAIRNTQPAERN